MLYLLSLYGLLSLLLDIFDWVDRLTKDWKIRRRNKRWTKWRDV